MKEICPAKKNSVIFQSYISVFQNVIFMMTESSSILFIQKRYYFFHIFRNKEQINKTNKKKS